jgi:hypothetical protein
VAAGVGEVIEVAGSGAPRWCRRYRKRNRSVSRRVDGKGGRIRGSRIIDGRDGSSRTTEVAVQGSTPAGAAAEVAAGGRSSGARSR